MVSPSVWMGGYHAAAIVAAIHSGGKPHMVMGVRLSAHRHHCAGGLIVEQQTIDGNGGIKQHPVEMAVRWIFPIRVHQQRSNAQQGGQKPKQSFFCGSIPSVQKFCDFSAVPVAFCVKAAGGIPVFCQGVHPTGIVRGNDA